MARNEEKAQAMLNRWWSMKKDLNKMTPRERPKTHGRIMQITKLNDCERYRRGILKEINKNVSIIQNAGLGEHRIRELNDEINKLIKEKASYEQRILELGGPDYKSNIEKFFDDEGEVLPGSGDYFYFGAAKDLPGVRELFQKKKPEAPRRNLLEIFKGLDYEEYFGKRDDDDPTLHEEERLAEEKIKEEELNKWIEQNQETIKTKLQKLNPTKQEILQLIEEITYIDSDDEGREYNMDEEDQDQDDENRQVSRPKKKWEEMNEDEKYVEKKKQELLQKYLGGSNKNTEQQNKQNKQQQQQPQNDEEAIVEELIQLQRDEN
ncbi:hypothetical protein ABPG74_022265 [Tetrahymena malaccensis]